MPALHRLGIVGSGQIARMTHMAAAKLGITPALFAEDISDAAAVVAPSPVINHPDSLAGFIADCDVVTFEHERIDLGMLEALEDSGHTLRPRPKTFRAACDKLHQRRLLTSRGFAVAPFAEVKGPDDLFDFAEEHEYPLVIKTVRAPRRGAKGVWVVNNQNEALRVLSEHKFESLLAEKHLDIIKELVVLTVRRPGGQVLAYPVVETFNDLTTQFGGCKEARAPAEIGQHLSKEATELATHIANDLDAVGILAVEMLLTTDGLVINDIAARPHNAGHFTIEACPASQFENHVRAVLDLPLWPTWMNHRAAVTVNIIGTADCSDPIRNLGDALAVEGAAVHLYGKLPVAGEKLGHITAVADNVRQATEVARRADIAFHKQ